MLLNPEGKLLWWRQLPKGDRRLDPREGHLRRPAGDRLVAGRRHRNGLRARRRRSSRTAPTNRSPTSKPATACRRTSTSSTSRPTGRRGSTRSSPSASRSATKATPPVLDYTVQEIDIHTGLVMWEWSAMGHVPSSETEVVPAERRVRPLPPELDPAAARRQRADLDARHLGRLPAQPGRRRNHLADRRQEIVVHTVKGARFYFQHDARLEGKHS